MRAVAQPRDERHPAGRGDAAAVIASASATASAAAMATDVPFTAACSSLGMSAGPRATKTGSAAGREGDAAGRGGSRDEQGLQQVGAEQTPAADAERAPHRRVAPARLRAHDHQPGHVGACHQQQERHAAQENEQRGLGVAEDVVGQGRDDRAPRA